MAHAALQKWFDRADELGLKGEYFEAHEELEAGWMRAAGDEKVLLQGLIQLAAGLHKLKNEPAKLDGALYLLDRGLQKLRKTKALLDGKSLAALEKSIGDVAAAKLAPPAFAFRLRMKDARTDTIDRID